MKKVYIILSILVLTTFFYSCNEITVDHFLLTNENTPLHNISYKYWYPAESKILKKSDVFVIENAHKNHQKKLWMITSYEDDSKKSEVIYLRRKAIANGNYIFQATNWETGKNISLFLGQQPNDSTFHFYGYNDEAMKFGPKSEVLNSISQHIKFEKDAIKFDSIASTDYKHEILEFIKELDSPKYYKEEIVTLIGTNDIAKLKSLLEE